MLFNIFFLIYHFQVIVWWIDASQQGSEWLNTKDDGVIEEVAVLLVVAGVAKLLVAPEEDHAEVVVEAQAASKRRQVRAPVGLLKNLKTKSVPDIFFQQN